MKKTVIALIMALLMIQIVSATAPQVTPLDKSVENRVKELEYSNSAEDVNNLKEAVSLYKTHGWKGGSYSVFKEVFLTYPNDILLNHVFLTPDKKFNNLELETSFSHSALGIDIMSERELHEIAPYLIQYLKENIKEDENGAKSKVWQELERGGAEGRLYKYLKFISESNDPQARNFFRNLLAKIDKIESGKIIIIAYFGKVIDEESLPKLLEFCKKEYLQSKSLGYFRHCTATIQQYKSQDLVKYVIENNINDYGSETYIRNSTFPSFILDKAFVVSYDANSFTYDGYGGISNEELNQKWKDWYKENKNSIVWSGKINKFVEKDKEDQILKHLNLQKTQKDKEVGFFRRIWNWLRRK